MRRFVLAFGCFAVLLFAACSRGTEGGTEAGQFNAGYDLSAAEATTAYKSAEVEGGDASDGQAGIELVLAVNTACIAYINGYLEDETVPLVVREKAEAMRDALEACVPVHQAWLDSGRDIESATPDELEVLNKSLKMHHESRLALIEMAAGK